MKRLFLLLTVLISVIGMLAQSSITPSYSRRDNVSIDISKIEQTPTYTIVSGIFDNSVMHYGWININSATKLVNNKTGQKYSILKSDGIPMSPNRYQFTTDSPQKIDFSFYFERVPDDVEMVDMIENTASNEAFNVYGIALKDDVKRPFEVRYVGGQSLNSRPSLRNRLNGVKEVQVYYPSQTTDFDKFLYGNLIEYFNQLGLRVDAISAPYKQTPVQYGTVGGYYRTFDADIIDYLKSSNTLAVVMNYSNLAGQYVGGQTAAITIIDAIQGFKWDIPNINVPNKSETLIKRFKSNISDKWQFDQRYAYVPLSRVSTWNSAILKDYISKGLFTPIEGIYRGDTYTIGVKKGSDNKYYIIYLSGGDNISDWHEGDVKGVLTNTAAPNLFKASWWGKWKQAIDCDLSFSNIGFTMTSNDGSSNNYLKIYPDAQMLAKSQTSSGTGFFLSKDGYIITNYHVIENAKTIEVTSVNGNSQKNFKAQVEIKDAQNDLAILKITDPNFKGIATIPYTFKFNTSNIGEDCFVLGYPLISSMGKEIKLTTGVISSKTGYEGNVAEYQISAPVQPGNSGGPLFDKSGHVIGIVHAKHKLAENAGYAIKASYIRNLVELLPKTINLPQTNLMSNKTLPKQVELASKAVCLIIVNGE